MKAYRLLLQIVDGRVELQNRYLMDFQRPLESHQEVYEHSVVCLDSDGNEVFRHNVGRFMQGRREVMKPGGGWEWVPFDRNNTVFTVWVPDDETIEQVLVEDPVGVELGRFPFRLDTSAVEHSASMHRMAALAPPPPAPYSAEQAGAPPPPQTAPSPQPLVATAWNFTHPGWSVAGSHSITVSEPGGTTSSSNYTVIAGAPTIQIATITASVGQTFTISGTLLNFTSVPPLYWGDDGASPSNFVSSITQTTFSFTHPSWSSAGNHTITISNLAGVQNGAAYTVQAAAITITINPITGNAIAPFTVTGNMTGYTAAPNLVYNDDGGSNQAITGTITATSFSFQHPLIPTGSHTLSVAEAGTSNQTSLQYNVPNPSVTITVNAITATADQAFTVSGSLSGFSTVPTLTYQDDQSTGRIAISGNTTTSFSFSHPSWPAAANHTLTVWLSGTSVSGSQSYTVAAAAVLTPPFNIHYISNTTNSITFGWTNNTAVDQHFIGYYDPSLTNFSQYTGSSPTQTSTNNWQITVGPLSPSGDYLFYVYTTLGSQASGWTQAPHRMFCGTLFGSVQGMTKVFGTAPIDKAINYLVMGDGFTSAQQTQFNNAVTTYINAQNAAAPINQHLDKINYYRLNVASNQSGVSQDDNGSGQNNGVNVQNYFKTAFPVPFFRGIVCDWAIAWDTAMTNLPQATVVGVIANTATYGGTGGDVLTFTLHASSNEIGIHEMGHTAFDLSDEYQSDDPNDRSKDNWTTGEPTSPHGLDSPNTTAVTNRSQIKWASLIQASTPIPTQRWWADCSRNDPPPDNFANPTTLVGAWEGAYVHNCGTFRPAWECRMRLLGQPFCPVCQAQINKVFGAI